jgi:hypothetical protein
MGYLLGVLLVALVSANVDGPGVLYPGYVANWNIPEGKLDPEYAFLAVTGIDATTPSDLVLTLTVTNEINPPTVEIRMKAQATPLSSDTPILSDDDTASRTYTDTTNQVYFLSAKALCTTSSSLCEDVAEAELAALTRPLGSTTKYWPPFEMLDQRRTAKFVLTSPDWLYFWFAATDDRIVGSYLKLYIGCQFYDDKDQSGVQVSVYADASPWPTSATGDTAGSLDRYPVDFAQRGNWVMGNDQNDPQPFQLSAGLYKLAFFNTQGAIQQAKFTIKTGFNKPPTQAGNLNASFSRPWLVTLIVLAVFATMRRF